MLRRAGTANVIGMIPPRTMIELKGTDFLQEKRIQGCMMGSNRFPVDMPRMVELYLQGRLKLDELISQRLPLERVNDAFDEMRRGELARSVVVFH
jgi:S-(hydroxymethyl)glutathione dehydrogenase/alcohol dehydrogenase